MVKIGGCFFSLRALLIISVVIISLSLLGFWQLDRAEQKKALVNSQQEREQDQPLQLSALVTQDISSLKFRLIEMEGIYDKAHQFLLDNQIVDGRTGYFVLTPFKLSTMTQAVLVNRGWVPVGQDRSQLPDVSMTETRESIFGRIDGFPGVGWRLEGAEIPTDGWPSVIQLAEQQALSNKLGYSVLPFQIKLDKDNSQGYRREWTMQNINMPPEKHQAYAFQWFALASVFAFLSIKFACKRIEK